MNKKLSNTKKTNKKITSKKKGKLLNSRIIIYSFILLGLIMSLFVYKQITPRKLSIYYSKMVNMVIGYHKKSKYLLTKAVKERITNDLQSLKSDNGKSLSPKNIFYPTSKSGLSVDEMNCGLINTPLEGEGWAFLQVEEKYGVNALFLAAIANHESDYGRSNIAVKKNNLFGVNANDSNPFNDAFSYSSYSDSILKVGKSIKILYLTEGGKYFNGFSSYGMNKNYSTDNQWAEKVSNHMAIIGEKILRFGKTDK